MLIILGIAFVLDLWPRGCKRVRCACRPDISALGNVPSDVIGCLRIAILLDELGKEIWTFSIQRLDCFTLNSTSSSYMNSIEAEVFDPWLGAERPRGQWR